MREAAYSPGVTLEEPFLQLTFTALPVIPALKITRSRHGRCHEIRDHPRLISPADSAPAVPAGVPLCSSNRWLSWS